MKRNLLIAAGLMLTAALLPACGKQDAQSAEKQIIGISIPAADHGWTGGVVYWAEQAKKDIEKANPDIEVQIAASQTSGEQVDKIENLMIRGMKVLVVLPNEPAPLTNVCAKVAGKGIRLVVVDRNLEKDVQDLHIAGDNTGFGRECGEVIAKELNGKGKIVIMEGVPCQVNTDRVSAFREVMKKYPEIEILESGTSNWQTERGLALMENFLQKHKELDAVWAGDDDVLIGALKAYQESGRKDVKLFLGGGGSKVIVKKVLDGDPLVRMTVTYPPKMIYVAAQEAVKALKGETFAEKVKIVPAEVVNAANAKDFYYPDSAY